MPDPVNPTPLPAANPAPGPATSTSTGLPSNVAAALACIPLIGGIVFFILEKQDSFVRFYSMQSIVFGLAWFLFNIVSKILFMILGKKVPRSHNVVALQESLLKDFPNLEEVAVNFLKVLCKAYRLRYPDDLEVEFSLSLEQPKILN